MFNHKLCDLNPKINTNGNATDAVIAPKDTKFDVKNTTKNKRKQNKAVGG